MSHHEQPRGAGYKIAWYAAVAAFSLGYFGYNFRIDRADLTVPICHADGDGRGVLSVLKGVEEHGWSGQADRLGAPGTAERYDYPLPEHLHYATTWLIGRVTGNLFVTFNVWVILSYPLTALCAFGVGRACGLSRPMAFSIATLYTFLPYHANRLPGHTLLAFYFTVPLLILLAVWIAQGRLPFFRSDPGGRFGPFNGTTLAAAAVCAVAGTASPYYTFFGCFFLGVAGLYRALADRRFTPLVSAGLTTGLLMAVGFACTLPFLLPRAEHGTNRIVAYRSPADSELLCLKISHLLLPTASHRVEMVGNVKRLYAGIMPPQLVNENSDATLGIVGAIGFLMLIGRLLLAHDRDTLLRPLSLFAIFALLLGTTGGFGGLFNFFVFAQFRCYNRSCVFVAFFCLLAVGVLVDRWAARPGRRRAWAAIALTAIGLLDLTSTRQAPNYAVLNAAHADWSDFVGRVEAKLPPGGMVFQLPAVTFPEAGKTHEMHDYAHMNCYLYSRQARWSYGTCRNRRWDEWQQYVASLPTAEMVRALAVAGFSGIYVDRRGYGDHGAAILAELKELTAAEAITSGTGNAVFFSLDGYAAKLQVTVAAAELESSKVRLLERPCVLMQDGFYYWPPTEAHAKRWAGHRATMRLVNPATTTKRVTLQFTARRTTATPLEMTVIGVTTGIDIRLSITDKTPPTRLEIDLPPGEHVLSFKADHAPLTLPAFIILAWYAQDVSVMELE